MDLYYNSKSMKLHWGNYIAIFFTCFVVFMLWLISKTFSINTELVSEDYYDKEIAYQQKIDKLSNVRRLNAAVQVIQTEDSIQFIFPEAYAHTTVTGIIKLYRPSDISKDKTFSITRINNRQTFSKKEFIKGNYVVHVDWKGNTIPFYTEETLYIK